VECNVQKRQFLGVRIVVLKTMKLKSVHKETAVSRVHFSDKAGSIERSRHEPFTFAAHERLSPPASLSPQPSSIVHPVQAESGVFPNFKSCFAGMRAPAASVACMRAPTACVVESASCGKHVSWSGRFQVAFYYFMYLQILARIICVFVKSFLICFF